MKIEIAAACFAAAVIGCSTREPPPQKSEPRAPAKSEQPAALVAEPVATPIALDSAQTLFPFLRSAASAFRQRSASRVDVSAGGTTLALKRLCAHDFPIAAASRPIDRSELTRCQEKGVEPLELPLAFDGIAVLVSAQNTWVSTLTVAELKRLWRDPPKQPLLWSDVRKGFPKREVRLIGPRAESGTHAYFVQAITGGAAPAPRAFTAYDDIAEIAAGIAADPAAVGFMSFAHLGQHGEGLKPVAIDDGVRDNGKGATTPSIASIRDGTYQPLTRPVFLYVSKAASERTEVQDFVHYLMGPARAQLEAAGFVTLPEGAHALSLARFDERIAGTRFGGRGVTVGVTPAALAEPPK